MDDGSLLSNIFSERTESQFDKCSESSEHLNGVKNRDISFPFERSCMSGGAAFLQRSEWGRGKKTKHVLVLKFRFGLWAFGGRAREFLSNLKPPDFKPFHILWVRVKRILKNSISSSNHQSSSSQIQYLAREWISSTWFEMKLLICYIVSFRSAFTELQWGGGSQCSGLGGQVHPGSRRTQHPNARRYIHPPLIHHLSSVSRTRTFYISVNWPTLTLSNLQSKHFSKTNYTDTLSWRRLSPTGILMNCSIQIV